VRVRVRFRVRVRVGVGARARVRVRVRARARARARVRVRVRTRARVWVRAGVSRLSSHHARSERPLCACARPWLGVGVVFEVGLGVGGWGLGVRGFLGVGVRG